MGKSECNKLDLSISCSEQLTIVPSGRKRTLVIVITMVLIGIKTEVIKKNFLRDFVERFLKITDTKYFKCILFEMH